MLWEALAFAVLGLAAALAATGLLPARLPRTPLVLATGPVAALTGGLVARTIFGAGRPEMTIPVALVVAAALLSLLARPDRPTPAA
ncbi:hypothetical protein [Actinacidiphila sp. ITFR-21]|uniref:hypothetical protein n=1 Tax=Actinacidiphila sp. ITFR-21 TaxID=3075199 RepID=UPI00288BDF5C|nr:hypothetical protein [Streptomyces sp. ITFR-21]WNI17868.1 hypothetical protein RLT57_21525 [Streptomyces sp. ITFR-21]